MRGWSTPEARCQLVFGQVLAEALINPPRRRMKVQRTFWIPAGLLALLQAPAAAVAIELSSPIGCQLGVDCFIQNYVDTDPAPTWRDFNCGGLTYDGHDGTDFRLRNFVEMQRGVEVRAAAAGTVAGVRNNVPDQGLSDTEAIRNRECGNGVLIDHEDGWQTQYCHLKRQSVVVVPGQSVKAGTVLGQVGFSGKTEFPHLHLTVRHRGTVIDPFTAQPSANGVCGASQGAGLWRSESAPTYTATALLGSGFTTELPNAEGARRGQFSEKSGSHSAQQLAVWVDIMGVRARDLMRVVVSGPAGEVVFRNDGEFDEPKVLAFRYVGKRLASGLWPTGTYTADLELVRDGKTILKESQTLRLNPD